MERAVPSTTRRVQDIPRHVRNMESSVQPQEIYFAREGLRQCSVAAFVRMRVCVEPHSHECGYGNKSLTFVRVKQSNAALEGWSAPHDGDRPASPAITARTNRLRPENSSLPHSRQWSVPRLLANDLRQGFGSVRVCLCLARSGGRPSIGPYET